MLLRIDYFSRHDIKRITREESQKKSKQWIQNICVISAAESSVAAAITAVSTTIAAVSTAIAAESATVTAESLLFSVKVCQRKIFGLCGLLGCLQRTAMAISIAMATVATVFVLGRGHVN